MGAEARWMIDIYGPTDCGDCRRVKKILEATSHPNFVFHDVDADPAAAIGLKTMMAKAVNNSAETPRIIIRRGKLRNWSFVAMLVNPSGPDLIRAFREPLPKSVAA